MRDLRLNMQDIARCGCVTRWHSVRCARNQMLAEHHYLLTMIARELPRPCCVRRSGRPVNAFLN